jgi:hypothetical protein
MIRVRPRLREGGRQRAAGRDPSGENGSNEGRCGAYGAHPAADGGDQQMFGAE